LAAFGAFAKGIGHKIMTEITLTLYRGLNGTNPSAFRIDEDGVSLFENELDGYKFNLPIVVAFDGDKVAGIIAKILDEDLKDGIAEYTPQFGENHWSLRFEDLDEQQTKEKLSKFAKNMLK
jgi:hypothetical protein